MSHLPNVVVFGEAGAGKGSVINMLGDGENAPVSSGASGPQARSTPYLRTIYGTAFRVFDTTGLDSISEGGGSETDPVDQLCKLVRGMPITLLVYVFRAAPFFDTEKQHYDAIVKRFQSANVRVVIVVTGLENEVPTMDQWWSKNEQGFKQYQMDFAGHACITAFKGRKEQFLGEYEDSKKRVQDLVYQFRNSTPFVIPWNALPGLFFRVRNVFEKFFARKG
jgi:predicted GTPase